MPRISKRVLTFRERQRRGAIMHPSTFAEIEREAAAGGARDPRAVAGAAYWKTLAARYRGNPSELDRAILELEAARKRYEQAKTKASKRAAAEDVEFWGNKAAFLVHGKKNPRGKTIPELLRDCDNLRKALRQRMGNPYFQETLTRGSRQVVIWANEESGPFHVDKYLNHGATPAGKLTARPLKSLATARKRGQQWLEAMSRSNPDELPEAERLYETFHGREPREILELTESAVSRGEYAALGDLVELTIVTPDDQHVKVGFKNDGVRLASTAEGTQLVLLGGNQDISGTLGMFGSADTSKDLLDLGEAKQIVYDAAKWQTDFTPQEWKHDFGEESGIRPRVFFDQLNKRLMFAGGTYRVERPGIVD